MVKIKEANEIDEKVLGLSSMAFDAAAIMHVAQKYLPGPACPEQERCYRMMQEFCKDFEARTGLNLERTYRSFAKEEDKNK